MACGREQPAQGVVKSGKGLCTPVVKAGKELRAERPLPRVGEKLCTVICPEKDPCIICLPAAAAAQGYDPVDQYGSKGFVEVRGAAFCWDICVFNDQTKGPEAEGMSDENDFDFDWVFEKDRETGEFFYGRVGGNLTPADAYWPIGTPASRISMCFESTGRPVFAVEHEGMFLVKREQAGDILTFGPFAGRSPQMFYNGEMLDYIVESANRDAVCYYLKDGDLKARFQRDNFGIEYTVVTGLPSEFRVLFMAEAEMQRMTMKLVPGAATHGPWRGKGAELLSENYPPNIQAVEAASFSGGFVSGVYMLVVIDGGEHDEAASFRGGFTGLVYTDGVVDINEWPEAASFAGAFVSGSYVLVVVDGGEHDEEASFAGAFVSGSYVLVVVDGGEHDEEASFAGGFTAGTYDGPVYISTTEVPQAVQGEAYSFQLVAMTGTSPYTWTITSGSLPSGLSLSSGGLISGTPTNSGSFAFTVEVEDAASGTDSRAFTLSVQSSAFDPTSIANCELWLDASDSSTLFDATSGGSLVGANGAVARWEDKSGNGRHVIQSTSSARPQRVVDFQNGRDVVVFDGGDALLATTGLSGFVQNTAGVTAFVVRRHASAPAAVQFYFSVNSGANPSNFNLWLVRLNIEAGRTSSRTSIGGRRLDSDTFQHVPGTSAPGTQWALITGLIDYSSAEAWLWQDGVEEGASSFQGAGATSNTTPTAIVIGANSSATAQYFAGYLAEVIIYNRLLSPTEQRMVETYLQAKWGTPTLP